MTKVNNLPDTYANYKYTVIIWDEDREEYWFYGAYNSLDTACAAMREDSEVRKIVESCEVESGRC